jgi:fermentation-respiration switch protein FrsA (DUF1100 family)
MRRHLLGFPGGLAACLLSTACTVNVDEARFFHPGPASTAGKHSIPDSTVEDVALTASDGTALGGVRIRQADADVEILYFGGNASRADDMVAFIGAVMRGMRVNVTMIDYRGYGRSRGVPTIESMKTDALTAFEYVNASAGVKPVIIHGVSIGGFVASFVAANRTAGGLVLEATAPDATTWAKNQIPLLAKPIVRVRITPAVLAQSNLETVKRHTGPLLLMTGSKDSVTPPRFMQPLLDASPSPVKRSLVATGAQHGHALAVPDARQAYREFLDGIRNRHKMDVHHGQE